MAPLAKRRRLGSRERPNSEEEGQIKPASVGELLRDRRDSLGWNLSDIAADLRIKAEYLTAIENNDISSLPGQVYATGFLRSYADFLGLDGLKYVEEFKRQSGELHQRPELNFPMPLTNQGIPGGGLIVVALIFLGLGYGAWLWYSSGPHLDIARIEQVPARFLASKTEPVEPQQTPEQNSAPIEATPPVATLQTQEITATVPPPPPTSQQGGLPGQIAATAAPQSPQMVELPIEPDANSVPHVFGNSASGTVVVKALTDAWVEILDSNHSIWSRLLRSGDTYNPPKEGLVLRTGNAGGIQVTLNGKVLPPFGQRGEVKRIPLDADKLTAD